MSINVCIFKQLNISRFILSPYQTDRSQQTQYWGLLECCETHIFSLMKKTVSHCRILGQHYFCRDYPKDNPRSPKTDNPYCYPSRTPSELPKQERSKNIYLITIQLSNQKGGLSNRCLTNFSADFEYCKRQYFRKGFNFANSQILCASRKLNVAKIKFFYYIHIKYNIIVKLKPSTLSKFDTCENIWLYRILSIYDPILEVIDYTRP